MWRLVTKPRITSHIRDRILPIFQALLCPIYWRNHVYFFMFYVKRTALFGDIHIEKTIQCPTLECVTRTRVLVFMHQLQTSTCSLLPQAVRAIVNLLRCDDHCPEKPSLTWLGFDPVSYFTYLELKSLNEIS